MADRRVAEPDFPNTRAPEVVESAGASHYPLVAHRCDLTPLEPRPYPREVGKEIPVAGNVRARVRAVVPVEIVEEFVDRPIYGFLEVEWLEAGT
jgi:hypothetical protein